MYRCVADKTIPIKRKGMKRTKRGSGRPDMAGKGNARSAILLRPAIVAGRKSQQSCEDGLWE